MPVNSGQRGIGITRTIREQLNFTNTQRWREFTNRRLELIDKFNLSSKKASEQDTDIQQIAIILRDEFDFPVETTSEFDKLVRAAVQSVRRNRKRASRARINHDRFVMVDESNTNTNTPSPQHHPIPEVLHPQVVNHQDLFDNNISRSIRIPPLSHSPNIPTSNPATTSGPPEIPKLPPIKSVLINPLNTDSSFTSSNSTISQSPSKNKLLKQIQNSKTCLLFSDNSPDIHEQNLFILGQSIITASISFVLERFFQDISNDSINYLFEKLNNELTSSKIVKSLGFNSIDVMNLTDLQARNMFFKLIGCCVKDYGFDLVCYNLSEIYHEIILNEYPLVGTQINKISKESLYMPLLPMIPKDANKETSKFVKLKFNDKLLEFKFFPLSNASPTFLELVENGKVAFGIQEDQARSFRLKHKNVDVQDEELDKLFKDLDVRELELELYEVGKAPKFTMLL